MSVFFKQDKVETSLKGYEVRSQFRSALPNWIVNNYHKRDDSEDVWDTDP